MSVIEAKLRGRGIRAPLHVMGSSGALMTAATARARPVDLVESGPGGRGQRRGPGGRRARRPGRDLVRHGRHDRQGRADPRRRGADAVRVRGRGGPGIGDRRGDRQRLPDPRLDRRPRRGRRGRRQHRLDRFGRPAAGRSAQRRRRPRARRATAAAAATRRSRTPTRSSGGSSPRRFAEGVVALDVEAAVRAFEPLARDARDRCRRGRGGRHPGRRVGHGRGHPAGLRGARPRPARLHAHRVRRRRAVACQPARGRAGHPDHGHPAQPERAVGARDAPVRLPARAPPDADPAARARVRGGHRRDPRTARGRRARQPAHRPDRRRATAGSGGGWRPATSASRGRSRVDLRVAPSRRRSSAKSAARSTSGTGWRTATPWKRSRSRSSASPSSASA